MNVEDFMFKVAERIKNKADKACEMAKPLVESDKAASILFGSLMSLKADILYDVVLAILNTIEEGEK